MLTLCFGGLGWRGRTQFDNNKYVVGKVGKEG